MQHHINECKHSTHIHFEKKRYKKEKQKKQTFRMCTMHTIYFIQNVLFCAVYDCGRQAGRQRLRLRLRLWLYRYKTITGKCVRAYSKRSRENHMKQYIQRTYSDRERATASRNETFFAARKRVVLEFVCAFSLIDNYVREGLIGLSNGL